MMNDRGLAVAGRLLMAILFVFAGIGKVLGFAMTVGYFAGLGIPMPQVVTALVIVIELGGGLALLAGYRLAIVATVLGLFTLGTALIGHQFWNATTDAMRTQQTINFLKNLAICGGFVMVFIDAQRRRVRDR